MPTNVEIKAIARRPAEQRAVAAALAEGPAIVMDQRDTFFCVEHGRLKLRRFADGHAELIHYHRPDHPAARASNYTIVSVEHPEPLHQALSAALGVRGEVRKRRELFTVGQTRIHLDKVADLGDFIELEVVMRPGQTIDEGEAIAADLMPRLGIAEPDLVEGAYVDLLESSTA